MNASDLKNVKYTIQIVKNFVSNINNSILDNFSCAKGVSLEKGQRSNFTLAHKQ